MDIIRITSMDSPLYAPFRELYNTSFPVFEQRTGGQQERAFLAPIYHLDVYRKDDTFIGFVAYWDFDAYVYVEHLAIHGSLRGQGYGGLLLKDLEARSGKRILLEIDPITDEVSANRLRFYQKCGFFENEHEHVHPPYRSGYKGHPLIVLSTGRAITKAEYDQFSQDLREVVMR